MTMMGSRINRTDDSPEDDKPILKYAGLMGHTFCVVCDINGERRLGGECDDIATARKMMASMDNGRIYRRTPKGWKLTG
jgi:hypothetical protein